MTVRGKLHLLAQEPVCIGCGCSELDPCEGEGGPCYWLVADPATGKGVCSECEDQLPDWGK